MRPLYTRLSLSSRLPASRNTLVPIFVNTPFVVVTFPIIVVVQDTFSTNKRCLFAIVVFCFVLLLFFSLPPPPFTYSIKYYFF